ncbi:hypothetical protein BDV28DRAFT_128688 [Aspergillus coremiiformis]|uniref:Uncharacterized protein n=1 Tax=Aspergillus coremiiformis TaxID=138285 RepID=A0A5N6ZD77_9EURO|nr:hypothetical protein BDV28DRAFT_128688 [Aspergillus coremiiformis]
MPESFDLDKELQISGIVIAGNIDNKLISDVQRHLKRKEDDIEGRRRQIQLHWNGDCAEVMHYFNRVIKPRIPTLKPKPCLNRWFIQLLDRPKETAIYRPLVEKGTYNVLIVIEPGAGFPRFYEYSHVGMENEAMAPVISPYVVDVPQREGAVVLFDATIGRQDSAVEGIGASYIILVY